MNSRDALSTSMPSSTSGKAPLYHTPGVTVVFTQEDLFTAMFATMQNSYEKMLASPPGTPLLPNVVQMDHVIIHPLMSSPSSLPTRLKNNPISKAYTPAKIKVIPTNNGSIMASFKLKDINSGMFIGSPRQRNKLSNYYSTSPLSHQQKKEKLRLSIPLKEILN